MFVENASPKPFDLQRAIAHSSFAPGGFINDEVPYIGNVIVDYMNYWSPNDAGQAQLNPGRRVLQY